MQKSAKVLFNGMHKKLICEGSYSKTNERKIFKMSFPTQNFVERKT